MAAALFAVPSSEKKGMSLMQPNHHHTQNRLAALAIGLAAAACATAPQVQVDRINPDALMGHRTFVFGPVSAPDPAFGPTAQRAAREEVALGLRGCGFHIAESQEADLVVVVTMIGSAQIDRGRTVMRPGGPQVSTRETGVRTPVGDVPLSRSTEVSRRADVVVAEPGRARTTRTVVVDVFDNETDELLWRGTSRLSATWRPTVDLEELRERLRAIARRFPGS